MQNTHSAKKFQVWAQIPGFLVGSTISKPAQILWGIIHCLQGRTGWCEENNTQLAAMMQVSESTLKRYLAELADHDLVASRFPQNAPQNRLLAVKLTAGSNMSYPQVNSEPPPEGVPYIDNSHTTYEGDASPQVAELFPDNRTIGERLNAMLAALNSGRGRASSILIDAFEQLYPGRPVPKHSRFNQISARVGGPGRLLDLLVQYMLRPPTGDILSFMEATAKARDRKLGVVADPHKVETLEDAIKFCEAHPEYDLEKNFPVAGFDDRGKEQLVVFVPTP
jgi:hypothetical protein